MSVRPADPARTYAVLIGIEAYAAGSSWDLDGPARDVLAMHAWLTGHNVPASQIQTLASPLLANAALFGDAGLATLPATSVSIRRALNAVRERQGDLLVLFWAGHGAIHQREHRLFAADATTADKRNWEWDTLRDSLESTYFAGFPRQIAVVDACADYRNDFEFSAPGESLPIGDPMPHEHFVFFATQPGQTALNLGEEKRGLFSQELLRQLSGSPAASWPPDMGAVAAQVERAFEGLIDSGKATQLPRFEWRDWNGNAKDANPRPAGRPVAANATAATLTFDQLNGLAGVLMKCQALRTESRRQDLLSDLRADIAGRIEHRSDTRSDIMNILRTAASYPGGLAELLQLVQASEGPSSAWQGVEAYVSGSLAHLGIPLGRDV